MNSKTLVLLGLVVAMSILLSSSSSSTGMVIVVDAVGALGTASIRTSAVSAEEEELPDFMIRPFGEVYFSWSMQQDARRNTVLQGTWNFTSLVWVGIGIKSDKRMHGPLIVCTLNQTTAEAYCLDYISTEGEGGTNRKIERDTESLYESSALWASSEQKLVDGESKLVTSITFSKIVAYLGGSDDDAQIDLNAAYRVIFAKGTWDEEGNPKQHHTDDTETALLNFVTGKVESLTSGFWKIALGINCGICVLCMIIFKAVRIVGVRISHTVRNVLSVFFCAIFLLMLAGFIFAKYQDFLVEIAPKAFPRAFGEGAALCFACLLMPVSKRILFPNILGIAYGRAIKYHAYVALLFVTCVTIHGVGMLYFYDFEYILRWRDKDTVSRLPGVVTYILVLFMIPLALLRFKIGYRAFRWSHYAYILVAFFSVCHYPFLAIYCTPGLSLLALSFLHRRLATPADETETIKSLSYNRDANAVTLVFVKDDAVDPGEWYFLSIDNISHSEAHPFSVCKLDHDRRQRYIKFVIRPTPNPSGWTRALRNMAVEGKMPTRYKLDGPHCSYQVQCRSYSHILLICGGMAITGHNHFLDQCLDDNDEVWMEMKRSITLIWVVREADLFHMFSSDLSAFMSQMEKRFFDCQVIVKVFVTSAPHSGTPAAQMSIAQLGPQFGPLVQGNRPEFSKELVDLSTTIQGDTNSDPVATYVSGPPGFQESVGKALGASPMTHHIDYECYTI